MGFFRSVTVALLMFFTAAPFCEAANSQPTTGFLTTKATVDGVEYKYAFYVPKTYDPNRPMPVIVFLHGAGNSGTDGKSQLSCGIGPAVRANPEKWPFIIIFPQKPDDRGWCDFDKLIMAALERIEKDYSVDKSRIYLTGLSAGGQGTLMIAAVHPDLFAAIAPMCGFASKECIDKLKGLPCWAFHCEDDPYCPADIVRQWTAYLKDAGTECKLTVYPDGGHNCWDRGYQMEDLPQWFLKHSKNQTISITGPDGIVVECPADRTDLAHDLMPEIIKRLADGQKRLAAIRETVRIVNSKQDDILKFLTSQLGLNEPTDAMKQMITRIPANEFEKMISSLPSVKNIRIWDVDAVKAQLTKGEAIPGLQLDPATGQVTKTLAFRMGFTNADGDSRTIGDVEDVGTVPLLIKSKDSKEAFAEAIRQLDDVNMLYDSFTPQLMGGSIHEAAEMGVITGLNLTHPYRRWFCDGLANYLAGLCLKNYVSNEASQAFLANYSPARFEHMKDLVDLRYWRGGECDDFSPGKWSKDAENAAYAFATAELTGLADRHGANVIPAICKEIAKSKQPTDGTVLDAIQTVTKEDFRKTLDTYGSKAPKDKLIRLAIRGFLLGTTTPGSDENKPVNQTHKMPLNKDGKHGVVLMFGYATPDPPISLKIELVGPAKTDGTASDRTLTASLDGKNGVMVRGFMFPDHIDQPGKYTLKLYLERQPYKDIDFEVVAQ